jgi:SdrD B-like protein
VSSALKRLSIWAALALAAGLVLLLASPAGTVTGFTISGMKFEDLDGDGVKDLGEPGIKGWVIHLFGAADEATVTDANGNYSFDGLQAGSYTVCEELPDPWIQSFPNPGTDGNACEGDTYLHDPGPYGYTLSLSDNASSVDFGNYQKVSKEGVKFEDVNNDHIRSGGEPRLGNWEIRAYADTNGSGVLDAAEFTAGPVATTTTATGTGFYHFSLNPGKYIFCEVLQAGFIQTFPTGMPAECAASTVLGPQGYAHTLNSGDEHHANDFGNHKPPCEKGPVQDVLNPTTGRFLGNDGPDVIVETNQWPALAGSVQNAVDTVTDVNGDGYLIVFVRKDGTGQLGGHTNQDVAINQNYAKTFALIGCSVTLHDPDDSDAAIHITSTANSPSNMFLMDLHAADSALGPGILVDGNGRYLRNEDSFSNAVGFQFVGNSNTMHNGSAERNTGVGVLVQGNSNKLDSADSNANGGHGFQVSGNSNQLIKLDSGDRGKGNGGDGVNVSGDSNVLSEISAFANGGDGIDVSMNLNQLLKNVAGDSGKGNLGDGIRISGFGNNLQENRASSNGLPNNNVNSDGFDLAGGTSVNPNVLKSNRSNTGSSGSTTLENKGAEYRLSSFLRSLGSNTADGITVPKTTTPVKCNAGATQFPTTNAAAASFATACE